MQLKQTSQTEVKFIFCTVCLCAFQNKSLFHTSQPRKSDCFKIKAKFPKCFYLCHLLVINETCSAPSTPSLFTLKWNQVKWIVFLRRDVIFHISGCCVSSRALIRERGEKKKKKRVAAKWSSSHLRWRTHPLCQETLHIWFFIYISAQCNTQGGESGSMNRFAETNFETSVLSFCLWLNIVLYPIPQCQLLIKNV